MTASTIFVLLLVLACPLMMVWMMGGHGHGGGHDHEPEPREASTDDLRRRRDELERLIEEREQDSERELTPSG
jgi:hypothetical protein